jgi:hypothetical protein
MRIKRLIPAPLVVVLLTLIACDAHSQLLEVLALEGQQAPGLSEGTIYQGDFRRPVISGDGYVAFKANINDGSVREALFFGKPGQISAIVVQDDVAPGAGGDVFCKFETSNNPNFTYIPEDDGSLVFTALVLPPGYLNAQCGTAARLGIWRYLDGEISLIALEETQAADVAVGLHYKNIIDSDKHFRYRNGYIQFAAMLYDSVGQEDLGVTIWSGPTNDLKRMVTEGDEAPGLEPITVTTLGKRLVMNGNGVSLLYSSLEAGGDQAFWIGTGASYELLLRTMTPAPEYGAGVNFFRFGQTQPYEWGLNDLSTNCWALPVFYDAQPAVQYDSLWRETDGSREALATEEFSTTGIGESYGFTLFRDCWVNGNSRVLFRANASSSDPVDTRIGLWLASGTGDSLALEFLVSNSETLADETGNHLIGPSSYPSEAHINDRDNVFFKITVVKEGVSGNKESVWMIGQEGQKLLALAGQTVNDGFGTQRTLGAPIEFGVRNVGTGNQDGRPSSVSNRDQAVLKAALLPGALEAILASPSCCGLIFKDGFEAVSQAD